VSAELAWLVYGATGYTGELVAREAAGRGLRPVLAGRSAATVAALAGDLGLAHRVFPLDDPAAVTAGLEGMAAVLHCAGPFVRTSRPMVDACLAAGCHYLDVTGEPEVFEDVLGRRDEARSAGVALLPGVGFDVVPTDCLAARLAAALPGATHLELAFASGRGGWSRGTLSTVIEAFPDVAAERRDGRIVPLRAGAVRREIAFPSGPRQCVAIRWGDVSTASHTTGIPNVRVYLAMSERQQRRLRRVARLLPVLGLAPVKRMLQRRVARSVTGPSESARAAGRVELWGEARDAGGRRATLTMTAPEGYTFTVRAALACVQRVLAGVAPPGAWTPAGVFGADLVATIEGVEVGALDLG